MSLCAAGLQKSYNDRVVLEADLEFAKGSLYAILGPNGSGKSTLLKILAGLEKPDLGKVTIAKGDGLSEKDNRPVLVPSRKGLFNDTVYKNVSYGLGIRKVARDELRERSEEVLGAVGLWQLRKTNALTLSDGEAQ